MGGGDRVYSTITAAACCMDGGQVLQYDHSCSLLYGWGRQGGRQHDHSCSLLYGWVGGDSVYSTIKAAACCMDGGDRVADNTITAAACSEGWWTVGGGRQGGMQHDHSCSLLYGWMGGDSVCSTIKAAACYMGGGDRVADSTITAAACSEGWWRQGGRQHDQSCSLLCGWRTDYAARSKLQLAV